MGLDTTHDAWHGAYSAFNRFRQAVAKAAGGSYPPHEDKTLDDTIWYSRGGAWNKAYPGLTEFFNHSDCDGDISPEMCELIANEMGPLLPALDALGGDFGHTMGGYGACARRFIAGCRLAAANNERLEFQ